MAVSHFASRTSLSIQSHRMESTGLSGLCRSTISLLALQFAMSVSRCLFLHGIREGRPHQGLHRPQYAHQGTPMHLERSPFFYYALKGVIDLHCLHIRRNRRPYSCDPSKTSLRESLELFFRTQDHCTLACYDQVRSENDSACVALLSSTSLVAPTNRATVAPSVHSSKSKLRWASLSHHQCCNLVCTPQ